MLLTAGGCQGDDPTQPGTLRFGQVGEMRIELVTPLRTPVGPVQGHLEEVIIWSSNGAWRLEERIWYRGTLGDETVKLSPRGPTSFASLYASLITQVNETQGLELFIPELDPDLVPACGSTRTQVLLSITDDARGEEVRWNRCANGSLTTLTPAGAGPDLAASRVIQVAREVRTATQGEGFESTYNGSLPFSTLDRGESSGANLEEPIAFVGPGPAGARVEPAGWREFWADHTRSSTPPPPINWNDDMVIAAGAGVRFEAGDSIEIRRVLAIDEGALIEWWETIPGDFCSPASRTQIPFHIIVAPRTDPPILFADLITERKTCGGF